jgi:hypothetical protein
MKMVDDKLRIIDDVPSSAVEMAVKEKVCSIKTSYQKDFFLQSVIYELDATFKMEVLFINELIFYSF